MEEGKADLKEQSIQIDSKQKESDGKDAENKDKPPIDENEKKVEQIDPSKT